MKTIYLLIIAISITCSQTNAQIWNWTKPEPNGIVPNNTDENDYVHDIEVDQSGNVYMLGDFNDSLFLNNKFRAKGKGSYLAKYDSTGALLWYKLIVPMNNMPDSYIRATDLTINTKGVFITGKYNPGYYTYYNCSTQSGDGADYSYAIGNYAFSSSKDEIGFFLTKFNFNGNLIWNKTGSEQQCINAVWYPHRKLDYNPVITTDKDNNIIASFAYQPNGPKPFFSIGGDVVPLSGSSQTNPYHIIVIKYNSNGLLQWSNYAIEDNPSASTDCNSIITDKNGNIFLYGLVSDGCKFGELTFHTTGYLQDGITGYATFLAKISSTGSWQFVNELFNSHYSQNTSLSHSFLATDNLNNVYALINWRGNSYGSFPIILGDTVNTDSTNTFLVKLSNSGSTLWRTAFGTYDGRANSIYFTNNFLFISGGLRNRTAYDYGNKPWCFSKLTLQPSSPDYGGSFEYYVSKANTNGDFQWMTSFSSPYNFMEGLAVKVYNDNVYSSGDYIGNISSLGNLNGVFSNPDQYIYNQFFGRLKDQYVKIGIVMPTELIPGCTITIPFKSYGLTFSNKNKFTAELSDVNGDFTTPATIGTVKSTGTGSINATIPTTLPYGNGYVVRIRSSDTLKTGYNYYAYADTPYKITLVCPAPSSGFAATNITATSAKLNWAAIGCASGYRVQYRIKGTSKWTTAPVITTNAPTLSVTGLTANTTYQWRVATKCKNNGATSFSAYSAIKQFTTAPAVASVSTDDATTTVQQGLQLKIEPNPASSTAFLIINSTLINASVVITDFAGKIIWKKDGINTTKLSLPVQHFSAGVYMVRLSSGDKIYVAKLVKQ